MNLTFVSDFFLYYHNKRRTFVLFLVRPDVAIVLKEHELAHYDKWKPETRLRQLRNHTLYRPPQWSNAWRRKENGMCETGCEQFCILLLQGGIGFKGGFHILSQEILKRNAMIISELLPILRIVSLLSYGTSWVNVEITIELIMMFVLTEKNNNTRFVQFL